MHKNYSVNGNFEIGNKHNNEHDLQEDLELSASEQLAEESMKIEDESINEFDNVNHSPNYPNLQSYILSDYYIQNSKP